MPFLSTNQQYQRTDGWINNNNNDDDIL